jgi:hypothetical protein
MGHNLDIIGEGQSEENFMFVNCPALMDIIMHPAVKL